MQEEPAQKPGTFFPESSIWQILEVQVIPIHNFSVPFLQNCVQHNLTYCNDKNIIAVRVSVCVRVRIQRPDDVLEVCPSILTEDSMQAQHLGATLALYNLVKGQVSGTAVVLKPLFKAEMDPVVV